MAGCAFLLFCKVHQGGFPLRPCEQTIQRRESAAGPPHCMPHRPRRQISRSLRSSLLLRLEPHHRLWMIISFLLLGCKVPAELLRDSKSLICRDSQPTFLRRLDRGGRATWVTVPETFFNFFAFHPLTFGEIVGIITYHEEKDTAGRLQGDGLAAADAAAAGGTTGGSYSRSRRGVRPMRTPRRSR